MWRWGLLPGLSGRTCKKENGSTVIFVCKAAISYNIFIVSGYMP